ncbi:Ni/Fe-hydrogenase 2 integral membrane subunit HybB [Desulfotomaculum arcticum]|uniref:Ni/Fe-hydrogenase 2 integral membrane subunit HybB n=1 Tax=Desulfotruncus arcticus DSM 17038 TaxID=1121424 RepID=A0A1I2TYP5_9FIRM|nr:Ni/Fe-hydrogenase cytochrome b subunit [Desulfotruncus arcticus]SFG69998.1 Ni/Fe-hydrogenase 2 integral membrane subunit HybB [Desulfotomaculum arcticum] [Desulfotruncus arcticus DSM 17038]
MSAVNTVENKWTFKMTPTRYVLAALGLLGAALMLYRLAFGLGSATNLNDQWPWGLWIGFDVLTGVALAGGGYSTCLLVHVLRVKKFTPIARSAMLTSLIGYLLVMAGLFMDIGRWFNFWRPFVSWGYTSVLFEVFWCVSIYTMIQLLEFGEIGTEKVQKRWHGFFKKIMPVLFIIGIVLPTLHQSSLGSLYVIEVGKLYPLWWSMLLPVFFLMSSFFVGPAMVTVETLLGSRAHGHKVDSEVLQSLIKVSGYLMLVYLVLKIVDLYYRGAAGLMFSGNLEGNMFLLEMVAGVIIPLIICFTPSLRKTSAGLTTFSVLVVAGVIINRMNVVFTGMAKAAGGFYFPSFIEWAVSIGLVAIGVLGYLFIVENFNIVHSHQTGAKPLIKEKKAIKYTA